MRIAIVLAQVPFIRGGAEILVDMLKDELNKRGHQAEIITIPFKWYPVESLAKSLIMGRMLDLKEINGKKIDMVIATKVPAIYLNHDNKVIWLMHQHRQAYDLWNTPYGDLQDAPEGETIRNIIEKYDNQYISEAKRIYTISATTTNRLYEYNHIKSEVLYHPPLSSDKMRCDSYGEYIFYASRINPIKRQRLLVEAAKYTKTNVKIIIAGSGEQNELEYIKEIIKDNQLEEKVKLAGFISEEEKINYYANCLGVYFGAYNEDYGYITLEAFFSRKPVIVHKDAGGPLEFVEDGKNGFVIDDDAKAVAEKIDQLYSDRALAHQLGENGYLSLFQKNIDWDYVIEKLISE